MLEVADIKITAHINPAEPQTCKFVVDRSIYTGSAFFQNKEKAEQSLLAQKLFEVEGIESVLISGSDVTVVKISRGDWGLVAFKIGAAIRTVLQSGEPVVSADFQNTSAEDSQIKSKIQEIFDAQINPAIAAHGGVVDLIDVKGGVVYVRMGGGCQGCGMANVTLRQGIEVAIREKITGVKEILDVTDHASGSNPYYSPAKK